MSETPQTSWGAVVSLVLGVLSLVPILLLLGPDVVDARLVGLLSVFLPVAALTALPALCVGLWSLRAINASDGRLRGAPVAIAGLITGLLGLLPAVLGVVAIITLQLRATSQEMECRNNLRVLGTALNKYAEVQGSFPPAALGPADLPPDKRVSWMVALLPLMAENTKMSKGLPGLAEKIDTKQAWDAEANEEALNTTVRFFQCPGHPNYSPHARPAPTHYVGISGLGEDSVRLGRKDADAGVFGYDRGVNREEAAAGISYTLAVLETARDNGPWLAAGHSTVRGLNPKEEEYLGPGRPFGGLHPNVTQALWLDGSSRPIRNNAEPGLLRRAATLRRDD
jgi:hypothetical protein